MLATMVGWRLLTMLKPPAQLAQWAATLVCTALVSPNPPTDSGRCARTFADGGAGVPKMARRQSQTWASCLSANACVSPGRTMRNQKLALVGAHINSNSQHAFVSSTWGILSNNSSMVENKIWVADWCAQNVDLLFRRVQPTSPPPHDGIWFHRACSSGDCLNADVCMTLQLLSPNCQSRVCKPRTCRPRRRTTSRCHATCSALLPRLCAVPQQTTSA